MRRFRYYALALAFAVGLYWNQDTQLDKLHRVDAEGCRNGNLILDTFNKTYGRSLERFMVSAADNRRAIAENPLTPPSLAKQNARAAKEYYQLAAQLRPFPLHPCE